MRGVSPSVAFVLIIVISVISSTGLYYWLAGASMPNDLTPTNTDVQIHKVNSTTLRVTNLGVTNSTSLDGLETSAGQCAFASSTVLAPGVSYSCSFSSAPSGQIQVWANGVKTVAVHM